MAISCDPAALLSDAACFLCVDAKLQAAMIVRLLCAIQTGESMSCDPATLANEAKCFLCFDLKQIQAVSLSILCQIATTGISGGGGVSSGAVDPAAAPSGGNGLYLNTADSSLWAWNSALAGWVKLIG